MPSQEQLRASAEEAFASGKLSEAIGLYRELESLDGDPEWARREAQALNRLGNTHAEIDALDRAARGYQQRGEILKAAVTSKLILAINPEHEETRARIPELVRMRDLELRQPPRTEPPPPPTPEVVSIVTEAVHNFYFRDILPRPSKPPRALMSGIHRIALRGDKEDDFDIIIEDPVEAPEDFMALEIDRAGNIVSPKTSSPLSLPPEKASAATDALKNTIFAELSASVFEALLTHARLVTLEDGQELFHQGDVGDAMYVVVTGKVGVIDEGPPRRGIAKLGESMVFGEIAVITDQPRTATVVSLGQVELIEVDRDIVSTLTALDPRFLDIMLRFVRDRLVDRLLSSNPLFTALSERDRTALKPRFQLLEVDEDAVLIEQGKVVNGLVILLSGAANVLRDGKVLATLLPGDVAGEISLLTQSPALGEVRASTRSLAVNLPAQVFHTIVNARPDAMSFVQRIADQRVAQSRKILSGDAPHAEGHVKKPV